MRNLENQQGDLWDHCREVHAGRTVEFGCSVTGSFGEPLKRQIDEAERIDREPGLLLNSKSEWCRPAGITWTVSRM